MDNSVREKVSGILSLTMFHVQQLNSRFLNEVATLVVGLPFQLAKNICMDAGEVVKLNSDEIAAGGQRILERAMNRIAAATPEEIIEEARREAEKGFRIAQRVCEFCIIKVQEASEEGLDGEEEEEGLYSDASSVISSRASTYGFSD